MGLGDLVYAENMGAYCAASSTFFNGFPPAKIVPMNQLVQVVDDTTGYNNVSPAREHREA
jgi:hypothetical protein